MRTAIFPARFDQLNAIREFVTQAAKDAGMDESNICAVEMAVDEACSNIVEHAYKDRPEGDIECTCDSTDSDLMIILRDHGRPFNVSTVPNPDLLSTLEDRKVGGLGVFLIHNLMDEVRYEHLGEAGNVLTMVRRIKGVK
ncbi:MAG: ATP-binding protein [Chloroflexota bacterium]